jgi:hypothetical protein
VQNDLECRFGGLGWPEQDRVRVVRVAADEQALRVGFTSSWSVARRRSVCSSRPALLGAHEVGVDV